MYVAEVGVVVHQVGVVSYDGCFHLLERLMVCEEIDPDFEVRHPISFVVALVVLNLLFNPRRSNKFGVEVRFVNQMSLKTRQL